MHGKDPRVSEAAWIVATPLGLHARVLAGLPLLIEIRILALLLAADTDVGGNGSRYLPGIDFELLLFVSDIRPPSPQHYPSGRVLSKTEAE